MSTKWTIARARQGFSELLRATRSQPQSIYNRDRLVAAVIDAETYEEFVRWSHEYKAATIADAFDELRAIARGEDGLLEAPSREDRDNSLLPVLDGLPG